MGHYDDQLEEHCAVLRQNTLETKRKMLKVVSQHFSRVQDVLRENNVAMTGRLLERYNDLMNQLDADMFVAGMRIGE